MRVIVEPSLEEIERLVADSQGRFSLFSPYLTDGPLDLLESRGRYCAVVNDASY